MQKGLIITLVIIVILGLFAASSYNGLLAKSQAVDASWGAVQTDYQRRSDLVPNLVSTVKGAAGFEQQTLVAVVDARAKATSVNFNASDATPENIAKFQAAQGQLSGALSRLLVVSENYPQLRATEAFANLQSQLEGTENRIATSRKDFNNTVQPYNIAVKGFPGIIFAKIFGFQERGYFAADAAAQTVPKVDFGTGVQGGTQQKPVLVQ